MKLIRRYQGEHYTIGSLYLDNAYLCDTLEDKVRHLNQGGEKVPGETAIPFGTYKVELTMSPKFKRLLPVLVDVPQFTGIRIHRGNRAQDTHGCILPGENKVKGKVLRSTKYEMEIIQWILKVILEGYQVQIEITE
jgi:hypothetical protein